MTPAAGFLVGTSGKVPLLIAAILCGSQGAAVRLPAPRPQESEAALLQAASELVAAGRPLSAGDLLARYLSTRRDAASAPPAIVLRAAEAYDDGRAWPAVLRLLRQQPWLADAEGGRGLLLIARALEGLDSLTAALATYRSYESLLAADAAAGPPGEVEVAFRVGYASVLARLDRPQEAAAQYEAAAEAEPDLDPWLRLSALQQDARAGDLDRAGKLSSALEARPGVPDDSVRQELALAYFQAGDDQQGLRLSRSLPPAAAAAIATRWIVPALLTAGDSAGAIRALEAAIGRVAGPEAGPLLIRLSPGWETRRSVAAADLRSGRSERAVAQLRAALEEAPPTAASELRVELAEAQFAARDYQAVVWTLAPLMEGSRAEAGVNQARVWLLAGRSFSRLGSRAAAEDAFRRSVDSGFGDSSAFAAYLLGDHLQDDGDAAAARAAYERAMQRFPRSVWAAQSQMRLGWLAFLEGDFAAALAAFDRYRRGHAGGSWYHASIYWAARSLAAAGDTAGARVLYGDAVRHSPLAYYGQLAARRIGIDPFVSALGGPVLPPEPLSAGWVRLLDRMDRLRALGWPKRAERELEVALRGSRLSRGQRLALSLALNDRGWTRHGMRLGLAAHGSEGRLWSEATLRAVYPLPYRAVLEELARQRGLDAALVAGLIRRESLFEPTVISAAGAVGLMQLLPRTALEISREAGLDDFVLPQLEVPEANLRLGTAYLARMLDRFDGYLPAGLISYNAGPNRYLRWREFPERRVDEELFVERIPFRETRIYAKEVAANAFVYSRLYALGGPNVDGPEPGS